MRKLLLLALILVGFNACCQTSIIGKWKTIDDNTGKEKSILEIYEKNGKLFGKIVKLFPSPGKDPDPVCNECPEDDGRYKKKIIGMEILRDMVKNGAEYSEGNILDPESGKIYRCKMWTEEKDLKVRGYWGPFYRTQTWKPAN
jgi:uncharacterized protein (DUF2147 family)